MHQSAKGDISMLYSLIPILLLTMSAISLALLTKKSFADLLAPILFSVMLVLYGFYVLNLLHIGRLLVIALLCIPCAVVFVLSIIWKSNRTRIKSIVTSPAFMIYLAAVFVFFIFAANKFVSLMDCLRLWGAYPKIMHSIGTFQMGDDSHLFVYMQSYPPGMPLLCYFFTSFSETFSEKTLFVTYSYFCFSLLLPFCRKLTWENKKSLVIVFISLILAPWMITGITSDQGYFYSSLYIDIPLGICVGYYLYRSFHLAENDLLQAICMVLSCGALVLLKDSGAFFSLCGILGCFVCGLLRRKEFPFIRSILFCVCSAILLGAVYGIWRYLLDSHGFANSGKVNFTNFSLMTLVRIGLHFIRTPVTGFYSITGAVVAALPAVLIGIFALKLLLARHNPNANLFVEYADLIFQFLCYALFFFGYCATFIYDINFQSYPSYIRYFGTLVASALYILAADCFFRHDILLSKIKSEITSAMQSNTIIASLLRSSAVFVRIILLISIIFSSFVILFDTPTKNMIVDTKALTSVEILTNNISDFPCDVYLCMPESEDDHHQLHHRIYYELLDDGIRVKNYFTDSVITDPYYQYTSTSLLDKLIKEEYNYVMLTSVDAPLLKQFPELFMDATLEDTNLLYRIDSENHKLIRIQ